MNSVCERFGTSNSSSHGRCLDRLSAPLSPPCRATLSVFLAHFERVSCALLPRPSLLACVLCFCVMTDPSPSLDASQLQVARYVLGGRNVAAVGAAGCGKSTLLALIVSVARQRWGPDAVVVLAWAGSAAQLVGGQTVASLLHVSVGDVSKERILSRILANPQARGTIAAARLVVIDEAPTIPGRWFDRLEYVFRRVAAPAMQCRPFGGRVVFGMLVCLSFFFEAGASCVSVRANGGGGGYL